MIYQLKIKGELDKSWSEWLGNIQITSEKQADGSEMTILTVNTVDQAVLFGIIDRLRDLNIYLISVTSDSHEI